MRTLKNITINSVLTLTGFAILLTGNAAHAFPAYSQKEKKPCLYCHVNPGGGGKRNAAGLWYKAHGLSFAGYTPEKASAAAGLGTAPKPAATPKPKAKSTPKPPAKPAVKKTTKTPPKKKG